MLQANDWDFQGATKSHQLCPLREEAHQELQVLGSVHCCATLLQNEVSQTTPYQTMKNILPQLPLVLAGAQKLKLGGAIHSALLFCHSTPTTAKTLNYQLTWGATY